MTQFTEEERERIRRAVEQAERVTKGEIVPMIVPASALYREAGYRMGLMLALLALALLLTIEIYWLPWGWHAGNAGGLVVTGRQPGRTLRLPPPDRRLDLLPLDLAGVREIVGQRRATAIFERSRGHPLFVVELAAAAPDAPLPDSLVESMRARTDALGDAAVTLRSAAVLCTDIDIDLLSAVTATAAAITFAHIENALGSRLVQERSRDFVFGHDLVREAIAASTTATRRAFLHREAAHWLDRQPAADPLRIAHHARLGGDLALAAHALGQAASLATERWAWAEAENMLDEALTLSADSSLRTARARVRLARADHDGALDDARAAALAGAGAEALELAGWAAYYKRDIAAATTLAQDGVSLATSDGQRARCLLLEGRIFHSNGNLTRADELFISAERLAEPEDVVAAHIWRGALLAHTGHSVEALSALGVVDHAPAVAKQPYANLHATLARAQAYALQGRSSEALRLLTTLHHDLAERGVVRFAGRIDNWKGWVLRNIGATGEADECNERALAAASSNGLHEAWANALLDLADAAIRRVDLADADRLLAEAAGQEAHGHAFRWRHTQRRSLLEARRHLAAGEEGRAGEALSELRKAGVLPTDRYGAITSILQARVDVRLGAPVNHASLMPTITALQTQAGLEAWWLVGELAADLGSEPVWQIAASMLNDLTMRADDRSSVTGHVNGRVLDALRPR